MFLSAALIIKLDKQVNARTHCKDLTDYISVNVIRITDSAPKAESLIYKEATMKIGKHLIRLSLITLALVALITLLGFTFTPKRDNTKDVKIAVVGSPYRSFCCFRGDD